MMAIQAPSTGTARAKPSPIRSYDSFMLSSPSLSPSTVLLEVLEEPGAVSEKRAGGRDMMTTPATRQVPISVL